MSKQVYFQDAQKGKLRIVVWLLLGLACLFGYGFFQQAYLKEPFGNNPMSDAGLLLLTFILLGIALLVFSMSIVLKITDEGVLFKMFPFHFKYRLVPFSVIQNLEVVSYNAISEFGGYGVRLGFKSKTKAFILSGDKALRIERRGKRTLIIGVSDASELLTVLSEIKSKFL